MIYVIDFEKFTCGARLMFRMVVHKETMSVSKFFGNKRYDAQSQIMLKIRATHIPFLEHDHWSQTFA
jgi:hypothetical protein